ncbi:MAG: heparinase II/III-family protein, partial [Armatimonadetes bacterium]|nr:heparinase II/III-family protein [Armatimonadota bacterium]
RDENWWFFRPGGHFVEGLGYTGYMGCLFAPFAVAYERASGQYLFADPRLREWLSFAAYQTTAQGEIIPWGTCESGRVVRLFALLSNQRYGRDLAPLCNWAFNWHTAGPHGFHVPLALAVWEPTVPGDMPPPTRSFDGSQTVVLKDNWGHDTVTVWFAGKDPTWPLKYRYGTYSQGDCGHFVIAAWDEVLAADSGYDHWKSHDYFGAEFHNVLLVDGKGPQQDTTGGVSDVVTNGPVRRARVTTAYEGCTIRRTVALVRGRYVLVADHVIAEGEHDYTWQVRSTCPPDSPGSALDERSVRWPGLDALNWRDLKPGKTQLTTVVPTSATLAVEKGRWRPMSGKPEFINQVAIARWRAASTTALFALIPNLKDAPDVSWQAGEGEGLTIQGPGWTDRVGIEDEALHLRSEDGKLDEHVAL